MKPDNTFVLQDRASGLFFSDFETWTEHFEFARKFPTASLAYDFALLNGIRNIKVVSTDKTAAFVI